MCDTFAIKRGGAVWFAKNADREPEEVQRVEVHGAVAGDSASRLRCTYIEIDQVPDRRADILSRPQWMWGAEMGVNDAGVAIGNEAVFSNRVLKKGEALLGMDLVRLGLERASSAGDAVEIMTGLLERHGQGGPAGYRDKKFRYDSSFLVADAHRILVLETAGRRWAVKDAGEGWSISNTYSLRADYDRACDAFAGDFKRRHESPLMPMLACAADRRAATMMGVTAAGAALSLRTLASLLRRHSKGDGFEHGSNRDVCMHEGGILRPHASTASMIVRIAPDAPPRAAITGTIQPCISLFKPVGFESAGRGPFGDGLFEAGLAVHKRAKGDALFRQSLRASIEAVEPEILDATQAGEIARAAALASHWVKDWLQ